MKYWLLLLGICLVVATGVRAEGEATDAAAAVVDPLFTSEQLATMEKGTEKIEFQAEVTRLMEILIHSLYRDREIFLREVISNAADALDKVRFLSLTDSKALGQGADAELDIKIQYDKDANTLTITDKGVGMTREGLIKYLGVVAKSGTTEFLEKMTAAQDSLSLIGQFGVGFYSVYLVADRVTVASKNNDDDQYVWQSSADQTFTISRDPRGNTLGRGTAITLHMKEDAKEFLNDQKLLGLVTKYSQFINFPIFIQTSKEVEKEVPDDSAPETSEEDVADLDKEGDATETDGEDADKAEAAPKTKKIKVTEKEWERANTAKAIWTRAPGDITDDEYSDFYKNLAKDTEAPLTKIHFQAEGEITFKSILYIPSKAETGLYDKYYEKSTALKLYVRRVLISDEFDDFLPRYLNFVRGVVDSEDLPLNVSRETLAQSKVLKVMSKKLTRKVLDMLTRLAAGKDEESEETEESDDKKDEPKGENDKYIKFWENFGKSIKLGVIDDRSNKAKLSKLLRYVTSKSEGKFISLQTYVDRMTEKQKSIYYLSGDSVAAIEASPFLERLQARNLEVVYMTDPLDEYVMTSLTEYDGSSFQSISKEGLKLPGDKSNKAVEEEFKEFGTWMKGVYGDRVEKVVISNRLTDTPMVLVTGQYGWSARMEQIMKAQTFGDASKQNHMVGKKTLEINPRHPIIKQMRDNAKEDGKDAALVDLANLLYDAALIQSGFEMGSPKEFAARLHRVVALGLDVDPAAKADAEVEVEADAEEATEGDAAPEGGEEAHDEL